MKKLLIIFCSLFVTLNVAIAQHHLPDVVYLIATAKQTNNNTKEGIYRSSGTMKSLYTYPPIHFLLESKSRGIFQVLSHYNYNDEELSRIREVTDLDKMSKGIMKRTTYNNLTKIDLDVEFPKMTKESAQEFFDSLRGKKVYIIDRTESTRTIYVIQVKVSTPREW